MTLGKKPRVLENIVMNHDTETGLLHLTIDLNAPTRVSSTGNTDITASSKGNYLIPGTDKMLIGLNVYTKRPKNKRNSITMWQSKKKITP